jgi:hypothetical protein
VRVRRSRDLLWRWQVLDAREKVMCHGVRGFVRKTSCTTDMHRIGEALAHPIQFVP